MNSPAGSAGGASRGLIEYTHVIYALIVVIGVVTEIVARAIIGIWVIYRVVRGWLALRERHALPLPLPA